MSELKKVDLSAKSLPDLSKAETADYQFGMDYWNPVEGEVKRVFFAGFDEQKVPALDGNGAIDLRVAMFVEVVSGEKTMICNGAVRLVSNLEMHDVQVGTPLQITYQGKKKNKTNNYSSDQFTIVPLNV